MRSKMISSLCPNKAVLKKRRTKINFDVKLYCFRKNEICIGPPFGKSKKQKNTKKKIFESKLVTRNDLYKLQDSVPDHLLRADIIRTQIGVRIFQIL